ncbi:MAG: PQQ-dependent sugar dehydrogenase [Tepidisphaeraceae bacterium]
MKSVLRWQPVVLGILWLATRASAQTVNDPTLRVNKYVGGFDSPTGVAFLDDAGTALVTEKNSGKVKLVQNRQIVRTVLDLPVSNGSERGLLSIALSPNFASDKLVYLYHTVAAADGGSPISNKIARYRWDGTSLIFDRKIIDLLPGPGPNHDGGKIVFDRNGKLLTVIGDLNRDERTTNFENAATTNRVAAILRLQPNGSHIPTNPFSTGTTTGAGVAVDDIYAYGVRNSFGIAVDPVTGDLWDSENGAGEFDEINRVPPGFNSGWQDIMGPKARNGGSTGTLVSLGPRANYQDPKMSWQAPVAPTDIEFMRSNRMGLEYRDDLFVGDVNTGSLYHFDLTSTRKSLQLTGELSDRVADNSDGNLLKEQDDIVFGSGFGVTSDLLTGPGGLFVLSFTNGTLYRISQNPQESAFAMSFSGVPEPSCAVMLAIMSAALLRRLR